MAYLLHLLEVTVRIVSGHHCTGKTTAYVISTLLVVRSFHTIHGVKRLRCDLDASLDLASH